MLIYINTILIRVCLRKNGVIFLKLYIFFLKLYNLRLVKLLY